MRVTIGYGRILIMVFAGLMLISFSALAAPPPKCDGVTKNLIIKNSTATTISISKAKGPRHYVKYSDGSEEKIEFEIDKILNNGNSKGSYCAIQGKIISLLHSEWGADDVTGPIYCEGRPAANSSAMPTYICDFTENWLTILKNTGRADVQATPQ